MAKIIVNAPGSPVQIQIKKGISKEKQTEYDYLDLVIGDYQTRVFFRSPLEKKEIQRVLAEGVDAVLND